MASRRDSASERLKKSIERAKGPSKLSLIELGREFGLAAPQRKIDWNDPAQRAACAHEALLLNMGELDEPIRKAFGAFGYNPLNPFHWRMLLWHFAYAHFPVPRKERASKKWNDDRWCKLLSDFGEVKASSRANAPDSEVCINIKKRFANRYPTETAGTLRRNLQYARDPSRNHRLAVLRDQFAIELRSLAITQIGGSSSPDAGAFKPMALKFAREYLESAWKHGAVKK